MGMTKHLEGEILIRTRHRGRPMPADRIVETVIHEVLHATMFVSGIRSDQELPDELEERIVSAITGPLYATLTSNRELRNLLRTVAVS